MRIAALLLVLPVAGCSTHRLSDAESESDPSIIAYREIVEDIPAGITRRQLYAIQPPLEKPRAFPPMISSIAGIAFYSEHEETHVLTEELCVEVFYQLASEEDFEALRESASEAFGSRSLSTMITDQASPRQNPGVPSLENPEDIVTGFGEVRRRSDERPVYWQETAWPVRPRKSERAETEWREPPEGTAPARLSFPDGPRKLSERPARKLTPAIFSDPYRD